MQSATLISTIGYAFAVIGPFYKALMDKVGRKPATCIFSAVTIIGFILFFVFSQRGASPIAVGILLGVYIGSFWNVTDLNGMMFSESAPTQLRGSKRCCLLSAYPA